MFKRLRRIKDLLWAAAIGLALLFLFIGLIAASFTSYHGDRTRQIMNLRGEKQEETAPEPSAAAKSTGLQPDGTLHPLAETKDAGESYLDSLCFLCDSSFSSLRSAALTKAAVWSSETGSLSMDVDSWKIRYPGDGSSVSPASAAMIAKPAVLILAVGSDGVADMTKDSFVENYTTLIRGIAKVSPDTRMVCLSLCSVSAAYAGEDLNKDKVDEINGWIRAVCIETGAYYGDLSAVLCKDGYLRDEYADGSGRALNASGLGEVLSYLRTHSLDAQ